TSQSRRSAFQGRGGGGTATGEGSLPCQPGPAGAGGPAAAQGAPHPAGGGAPAGARPPAASPATAPGAVAARPGSGAAAAGGARRKPGRADAVGGVTPAGSVTAQRCRSVSDSSQVGVTGVPAGGVSGSSRVYVYQPITAYASGPASPASVSGSWNASRPNVSS